MKPQPTLDMFDVSKRFGNFYALKGVQLQAYAGEVLALMGENGAGKSTLMKILAGVYSSDTGSIKIDGREVHVRNPVQARKEGINLIYQELSIAIHLNVAENVFMGSQPRNSLGFVDFALMHTETQKVLERLGARFTSHTMASELSIAEQQLVEIARALIHKSKVLIMDEPTATLSDRETERLFALIRQLRSEGIAIIYISHRMPEVYELADRVTVIRDGTYVGTLQRHEIDPDRIVRMMVGRELSDFYQRNKNHRPGEVVLKVKNLSRKGVVQPSTFEVRSGEILGLAGLVGAGRTELMRLLFGADPKSGGEIWLNDKKLNIRSPQDAVRAGIGYLPEDRKSQGLFLQMSALENIGMNVLDKHSHFGLLNFAALEKLTRDAIQSMALKVSSPASLAMDLSGGNQQKLLLARWMEIQPKVLILDEPTRGVDVGAKSEIYRMMGELAEKGVAVICISSELPEVIGLSDRVLVMREGEIVGEVSGKEITQDNIMKYATGAEYLASDLVGA
ncbi:sugar ABC transporter ATP-binding protein [Deinococcus cellulosilyticus]|uniref:Ribose import ATP-binding protein RbsA 2 n=1 Tax=Deinococcus cellulosilyticus (strain DSM 18568 / NBRC 106333 / KACC 11606 / 5516J-15) TaxID=1223518 RepID=A0A511N998_DEIC1|nr:sugar ABC transporter ATP-binding protein [Deinococcus cellulosilyticus]GEM49086.1 ribose import ATP-binding protein RbsA 2 [Deinococcus cellulosilyticus NBRC 106333 = KACC 11606]